MVLPVTAPGPIGVRFVAVASIVSISKEYGHLRSLTKEYFGIEDPCMGY